MKFLLLTVLLGASMNTFAEANTKQCLQLKHNVNLCTGDTVYNGKFVNGMTVLAIDANSETVIANPNSEGSVYGWVTTSYGYNVTEKIRNLSFTNVCFDGACTGDIIKLGGKYHNGGRIIAINPFKRQAVVNPLPYGDFDRVAYNVKKNLF